MTYKKGQSGNEKGRPKGTKNKTTEQIKDLFRQFLSKNMNTLQNDFNQLDARERLVFIEKVAKIVLPSKIETDNNINCNDGKKWIIEFASSPVPIATDDVISLEDMEHLKKLEALAGR